MKRASQLVLCAAVLAAATGQAQAGPILDQVNNPVSDTTAWIYQLAGPTPFEWSQTFTVGLTGTLTSVDLRISKASTSVTDPLLFDIRTTSAGTPTESNAGANILASVSIAAASVPTTDSLFNVDLTSFGLSVASGDVLAIALRSDDTTNGAYRWRATQADTYAGGSGFLRTLGTWGPQAGFADLNFRTYVDTDVAAVPEPSSIALLGIGSLVLVGYGWRRKRDRAA